MTTRTIELFVIAIDPVTGIDLINKKEKLNKYNFDEDVPVVLFIESNKHLVMCSDFDIGLDADGEELYVIGKESSGAVGVHWE